MSTPSTPEAKKKPWYKKWWIWAIVVIVIAAFASVTGDESEDTASDASSSETTSQVAEDAFGSCREVTDAGLTEIADTHPRWNPALDADGDGVGCETAPASESSEEEGVLEWQASEDYQSFCTGDPNIDPEVQGAVSSVDIPDNGHVQFTNVSNDSDSPGMITVFFALCSPATGDELREIAEDLAIQVRNSEIGDFVSEMGVNASYANPNGSESILRDANFQSHLHDGGANRENGSFRAAWEARN